jgi:hypothetical protein
VAITVVLELLDLGAHLRVGRDFGGAIDLLGDLVDLVPERVLLVVHELEIGFLFAQADHDIGQIGGAFSAFPPM